MSEGNTETHSYPSWSHTQNFKRAIRGVAPQHLLDQPTRVRVYDSIFWRQHCFGLNLKAFIDVSQCIRGAGGTFGSYRHPTRFLCLFLKLLELEPSEKVIDCFLNTRPWQMKYLRLLAVLYIRFTSPPQEVYLRLEPLLMHYEPLAVLNGDKYEIQRFDEVVSVFLHQKSWCGIQLPPLTPRTGIPPRLSPLNHLTEQIRVEIFAEFGMNPDGELFEVIEARKSPKDRINLVRNLFKKQPQKKKKIIKEKENPVSEIDEENKLRALLGLPLLRV